MSEPLILLHGIGSSRHVWRHVLPHLPARLEPIALDLPGFGDAPPLAGEEPTPAALARAVVRACDERGLDAVHVAGNSLGGWVALEIAKLGRTRSVCALSPAGFWSGWERRYAEGSLHVARGAARALAGRAEQMTATGPRRKLAFGQMTTHPERIPADEAALALRGLGGAPGWEATLDAMRTREFEGGADVPAPVTIAWGEKDRLLLRTPQAARARARLPQARHVILAGCGHVPTWDDPEQVARAIATSA